MLARRARLRRLMPRAGHDFASNDYLGFAHDPVIAAAVADALARGVPVGSGGSRLLRGNAPEHEALEAQAAALFGSEAALFLATGFAANLALLAALPGPDDLIVADALIHASAHDGMKLSRARSVRRIATRTVLRLSSMAMIHDAVTAGVGAAAMPRSLVQPDIDAGRLLDWGVLADHPVEVWALYPSHRHLSARVAAFVKLLLDRFENASPGAFARLAGGR